MKEYVVAVDLMGADIAPQDIYEAAVLGYQEMPHIQMHFLTTSQYIPVVSSPHTIQLCKDVILPLDHPLKSIRAKKKSTLCCGIDLLSQKRVDAFLSLGNTGALIAKATTALPFIADCDRPALLTEVPIQEKIVAVLDVGAAPQARADHLVQFAFLGANYMEQYYGLKQPKIALLNIGTEPEKGTAELKSAFDTLSNLKDAPFNFVGNIEPHLFFLSSVDIVVTSGFTGNIFLKTIEGTVSFVLDLLQKCDSKDAMHFQALQKQLYAKPSFGGTVVGVEGLIVKCHGSASKMMIQRAVQSTIKRLLQT